MDIIKKLTEELNTGRHQAEAAVRLTDEGNMIPFVAKYREEATDFLNDEVLRNLEERPEYLRSLEDRKSQVITSIAEQEKLIPELELEIKEAQTLVAVGGLYRPYKPKHQTRAVIIRDGGLEPLVDLASMQITGKSVEEAATGFVSKERGVVTVREAIQGARDILAERISDNAASRTYIRNIAVNKGAIQSSAKDERAQSVCEMYYNYEEPVEKAAGNRILAPNRGKNEEMPTVKVLTPEEQILGYSERQTIVQDNPYTTPILKEVTTDGHGRPIDPSIEREVRSDSTERIEKDAIKMFGKSLEQLLMQPPIMGRVALGWGPAFRAGCKLAAVDSTGKVLSTVVIYPTAPQNKAEEFKKILEAFIKKYSISLISAGDGTVPRESEQIIVDPLKEIREQVQYVTVNKVRASMYSASGLAAEEFPAFNVGRRSTVSIARRLQDPLSELVKIDPKSIGVGQCQHDVGQKRLSKALEGVVEDCVNKVNVDLNTASASLLEYMSGINKTLAKSIMAYREENGVFKNKKQLSKVVKLGPKALEQCTGFMHVTGGKNPLDGTSVRLESYDAAGKLLGKLGYRLEELPRGDLVKISRRIKDYKKAAQKLGIGEITLRDIAGELEKPARDPRGEMPRPILGSDIPEMKDLGLRMMSKGTVCNIIDFGASADMDVHQDGLVHISQTIDECTKHSLEAVSMGDVVDAKILSVDLAKERIPLTMKGAE